MFRAWCVRLVLLGLSAVVAGCPWFDGDGPEGPEETGPGQQVVGAAGGRFVFPGGVVLEVPPAALSTDVVIGVEALDPAATQAQLQASGSHARRLLGGVRLTPSGLAFARPIRVTLPWRGSLAPGGLPFHFAWDEARQAFYPRDAEVSAESGQRLTFGVDRFSPHVVAEVQGVLAQANCAADAEPCRCALADVRPSSRDEYEALTDCRVAVIRGTASYPLCRPPVTESWEFVEHSDGCVPVLTLAADPPVALAGQAVQVTASLRYAGDPLPAESLTLTGDVLLTLDAPDLVTGPDGRATTAARAGLDEGVAVVRANGNVEYAPTRIEVNGSVQQLERRPKLVQATLEVPIGIPPRLFVQVRPGRMGSGLDPGESTGVELQLQRQDPKTGALLPLGGVRVQLEASAGLLAAPSVVTGPDGRASVGYTAPSAPGRATVSARASVTVRLANGASHTYPVSGSATVEVHALPVEALGVQVRPGRLGALLPGEATQIDLLLQRHDPVTGAALPVGGTVVELEASAGVLSAASAVTDAGGRATLGYVAAASPGRATISARALVAVRLADGSTVTHPVPGSATVEVRAAAIERWTGVLVTRYRYLDPPMASFTATVRTEFWLDYDPTVPAGTAGGDFVSNLSGQGTARNTTTVLDSDPRAVGDCTLREYWSGPPLDAVFAVVPRGLVTETPASKALVLKLPPATPGPGGLARLTSATLFASRECPRSSDIAEIGPVEAFWNDAVPAAGDPAWWPVGDPGAGIGFMRVDLPGSGPVVVQGSCEVHSSEQQLPCSWSLTLTRQP